MVGDVKTRRRLVADASEALSDLNIFYAIIAILEGGTIHSPSYRSASFIIRHCKVASAKCLKRYDTIRDQLSAP